MISHWYDLIVRGDLANLIQILSGPTLLIAVYAFYRKHNCHDPHDWFRIGRYPSVDGKGWYYCKRHHNDHGVHK